MSKKCNTCGEQVDEQAAFCQSCGSTDLVEVASTYQEQVTEVDNDNGNGNIYSGIVGAFLLSLVGGIVYFAIYQLNIIAGISGLVIFLLANFGYRLFAKTKNKNSIVALVVAIVMTIVVIFLAEFFCVSFEIYKEFEGWGITFSDAVEATPDFLADPEVKSAFIEDLAFAYIFGFLASISNIVNIVKSRKNK